MPSRIHPSAVIDPAARLAPDITVGPCTVIDGPVEIGAGSKIGPHCHLIGPMTIGANNDIGTGVILGERPQHLAADGAGATVVIGDGNTLREHVTVHRGSAAGKATSIGHNNYLMAGAHVAHDCIVGNKCIFANNALLGGHAVIGDSVFLSGNSAVHQRIVIGRLAFLSGCSATTMDIPPFVIIQKFNIVGGVNVVGMRRAGIPGAEIDAIRKAFRIVYMQGNLVSVAVDRIEREFFESPTAMEFAAFIRKAPRGISVSHVPDRRAA